MFFSARDAASGLKYLCDQNIIHADIAARNVLVTYSNDPKIKYTAKIGDLGLSKVLQTQNDYYTSHSSTFPVKWSAPEVIEFGKYSSQSGN